MNVIPWKVSLMFIIMTRQIFTLCFILGFIIVTYNLATK